MLTNTTCSNEVNYCNDFDARIKTVSVKCES